MLSVNLEKAHVPVVWAVGLLALGVGWWANANDDAIEQLKKTQTENAKQIQAITTTQRLLVQREKMLAKAVEKAGETAERNEKVLIRVAEKLGVETD